jgi:hypothetical protein
LHFDQAERVVPLPEGRSTFGSFQGEAGPGGTMTVEGNVTKGIVSLDFTLSTELTDGTLVRTMHFTGRPSLLELRGIMQSGNNPTSLGADTTVFIREKQQ